MDTPPPVSQSPSSASPSPLRSGLEKLLGSSPGAAVCIYALKCLTPLLYLPALAEARWRLVLLVFFAIVVPTIAQAALQTVREFLLTKKQ